MRIPLLSRALPLALLPLALTACDSGDGDAGAEVRVMTRNLYLGAEIFVLLTPGCAGQMVPVCVEDLYGDVQASAFATRAAEIAAEIDEADADLVGLQEVSLYRTQAPSDVVTGTTTPNATTVELDFLALLLDALEARGLDYTVAAQNVNADVELPATANGQSFRDIRLTDSDVILARAGVTTSGAVTRRFTAAAPFSVGGQTVPFYRGFAYVTATVDGETFTFANAHLEVGGAAVAAQQAQAAELKAALPAGSLVLVGDLNSDPADAGADGASYRLLVDGTAAGLIDAWTEAGSGTGVTCCQAPDIRNTTSQLSERIDLVLVRGGIGVESVEVVGEAAADRTAGGLWPSDHAGVAAVLRLGADDV